MRKIPYAGKENRIPPQKSGEGRRPRRYDKPSDEILVYRHCLRCNDRVELSANQRLCESCRDLATRLDGYI